jgi:hypothetical protein
MIYALIFYKKNNFGITSIEVLIYSSSAYILYKGVNYAKSKPAEFFSGSCLPCLRFVASINNQLLAFLIDPKDKNLLMGGVDMYNYHQHMHQVKEKERKNINGTKSTEQ